MSGNGTYSTPTGYVPTATGTYVWSATYGGDTNNASATDNGDNESEAVNATNPAINTTAGGKVIVGSGTASHRLGGPLRRLQRHRHHHLHPL